MAGACVDVDCAEAIADTEAEGDGELVLAPVGAAFAVVARGAKEEEESVLLLKLLGNNAS